jgi:parvulin-like peptidyl-prolyl isomerase
MAKENELKTPKELTKKHLARVEKEKRQKKILMYGIIAVVVIIVGLIAFGILNTTVLKDSKPVAKVGNTTITVKQFEDRVKYDRYNQVNTFVTYASSYFASFFQSQLLNIQNQLDSYVQFGSDTLDQMINEEALVQKAKQMGITVTDEEVENYIQGQLQYYPSGTPTAEVPTATITYYPTSTLSALQQTLSFATPTTAPTEVATEAPTATATPVIENTPATGTEVATGDATSAATEGPTATLESTATATEAATAVPSITPTATVYTKAGYDNLYSTIVADAVKNASFSEAELRAYVRDMIYEQKIYKKISAEVSPEQDMVWARHILVATEADAKVVEQKLKDGESWSSLAAYYSTDTSNSATSGDLGWFTKGTMVQAFEDAAWSMKVGDISAPVKTDYGYHIIEVLGHEKRQLTADELTTAQKAAYNKFISDAKTEFGFKKYDLWASVVPSEPTIPTEYRISSNGSTN